MDISNTTASNISKKKYGKLDLPKGSAKLILVVHDTSILFYVNDILVLDTKDNTLEKAEYHSGRLNYALASGTNKDFGIRVEMKNVELWEFYKPQSMNTPSSDASPIQQIQDLNTAKGIEAFQKEEYKEAIGFLNSAIQENSTYANPSGFLYRGRAYYAIGEYGKAVSDFNEVIAIAPDLSKTYLYRGYAYEKQKKITQAIENYSKAIQLDPEEVWAIRARAMAYAIQRKYDQALIDFNQAIKLDTTHAPTYNNRCWTLYLLKRYQEALPDCEKAVASAPQDVSYLESRGFVYYSLAQNDKAAADLKQILSLTKDKQIIQRVNQALKQIEK